MKHLLLLAALTVATATAEARGRLLDSLQQRIARSAQNPAIRETGPCLHRSVGECRGGFRVFLAARAGMAGSGTSPQSCRSVRASEKSRLRLRARDTPQAGVRLAGAPGSDRHDAHRLCGAGQRPKVRKRLGTILAAPLPAPLPAPETEFFDDTAGSPLAPWQQSNALLAGGKSADAPDVTPKRGLVPENAAESGSAAADSHNPTDGRVSQAP